MKGKRKNIIRKKKMEKDGEWKEERINERDGRKEKNEVQFFFSLFLSLSLRS